MSLPNSASETPLRGRGLSYQTAKGLQIGFHKEIRFNLCQFHKPKKVVLLTKQLGTMLKEGIKLIN